MIITVMEKTVLIVCFVLVTVSCYASVEAVTTCGKNYSVEHTQGELQSPNYPSPYGYNQLCQWYINIQDGFEVKLTFQSPIDIKRQEIFAKCDDFVEVFDVWADGSQTRKGRYCKSKPQPLTSSGSQMLVVFTSNGHVGHQKGFAASWTKHDLDECQNKKGGCDHICTNTIGSWSCSCYSGFVKNVTKCLDVCKDAVCLHDGVCIPKETTHHCSCRSGWKGESCEIEDNEAEGRRNIIIGVSFCLGLLCFILILILIFKYFKLQRSMIEHDDQEEGNVKFKGLKNNYQPEPNQGEQSKVIYSRNQDAQASTNNKEATTYENPSYGWVEGECVTIASNWRDEA